MDQEGIWHEEKQNYLGKRIFRERRIYSFRTTCEGFPLSTSQEERKTWGPLQSVYSFLWSIFDFGVLNGLVIYAHTSFIN